MKASHAAIFLLLAAAAARADIVTLKDGSQRSGTIIKKSATEIQLRMDREGITGTLVIPVADILRIDPEPPVAPTATTQPATPATTRSGPIFAPLDQRGFLEELVSSLAGHGVDDPARLPQPQRSLWDSAMAHDKAGESAETMADLRSLEEEFRNIPGALPRLDAISRAQRAGQAFGDWMAKIHWETIANKYKLGVFDLTDVREVEREALIGIFRDKTTAAVEPLKAYFPPLDPKTGNPSPFKAAQLAAITSANALEVKDQALLATAILQGQLKLEPGMDTIDRVFISAELANVSHILSRARDLEPAARAVIARAELERKQSEVKAAREAAIAKQKAALGNK